MQQAQPMQQSQPAQQSQPIQWTEPAPQREPVRHPETPPPPAVVYRPFEPPPPAHGHAAAPAYPPSRRGPALFAAIAAVLAAAIAVVALVVVLAQRGERGNDADPDVPTVGGGPAPSDVRVRDRGTSVEISWTDPAQGRTSTIISGGHPGELLKPMGEVGPGETSFRLRGLNDQLSYCFSVVAVYGTDSFAPSPQVCVTRPGPRSSD